MKLRSPLPAKKSRLEIIPLIDVMFFLLASFMMVSLTMTKQQTIGVNLPVATATAKDFQPDMINIGLNAAGDAFWDKDPVTLPDLESRLTQRYQLDAQTPIYISGDEDTRHADMIRVLDLIRRIGFAKVAFNVKPSAP